MPPRDESQPPFPTYTPPRASAAGLSSADQAHVASYHKKQQVLRDRAASVAYGRTPGAYIFGSGGIGKSHTILEELRRLDVSFRHFNSRMTGRGLFDALKQCPDEVHLLEDIEPLIRDKAAVGVLLSALWGDYRNPAGRIERLVTWQTYTQQMSFVFTGGIIMTGNREFPNSSEVNAIKTRIACEHVTVSDSEIAAMMRNLALQGYDAGDENLAPEDCLTVCEYLIETSRGLNRPLDMRVLFNAYQDYLQWSECQAGCDWRDLVAGRLKERPVAIGQTFSPVERGDRLQEELALASRLKDRKSVV